MNRRDLIRNESLVPSAALIATYRTRLAHSDRVQFVMTPGTPPADPADIVSPTRISLSFSWLLFADHDVVVSLLARGDGFNRSRNRTLCLRLVLLPLGAN